MHPQLLSHAPLYTLIAMSPPDRFHTHTPLDIIIVVSYNAPLDRFHTSLRYDHA